MRIGIAALVLGYVLSQFYRAFLAVLTPALQSELGMTPSQLSAASGIWFVTFAAMQIPIGIWLDRVGPSRTAAALLAIGGAGGSLLFGLATSPTMVIAAVALIGVGCAPVLMASFYIFARSYSPAVFATLGGLLIAAGNMGNIGSSLPLTLAVQAFGWRGTVLSLSALTLLVALAIWRFVQDPPKAEIPDGPGGMLDILKMPAFWCILVMLLVNYVPAAAIRGLWAGPYFTEVHGANPTQVGNTILIMAFAMVAGNFFYGPLDRLTGSRKWGVLGGNAAGAVLLVILWMNPAPGFVTAVILIAAIGFFGMSFPLLMAHGRAFFPPHLAGRGVTLLNLFGIGGVGLIQTIFSGQVYKNAVAGGAAPPEAFGTLFGFFALILGAGCLVYAFSTDRTD